MSQKQTLQKQWIQSVIAVSPFQPNALHALDSLDLHLKQ